MPKPTEKSVRGSKVQVLDHGFKAFSEWVSDHHTRRGMLHKMGTTLVGLFGIEFIAPFVIDSSQSMAAQEEECKHGENCLETGEKCAMGHWIDCRAYKRGACGNCLKEDNGDARTCPRGTTRGDNWTACCTCTNPKGQTDLITFWDCCGTLTGDCIEEKCKEAVKDSGCPEKSAKGRCPAGTFRTWCTTGGNPVCSYPQITGKCSK